MSRAAPAQTLAAVDLGSNSFHMVVARVDERRCRRWSTGCASAWRSAAGLDEKNDLDEEAQERALACLAALRPAAARRWARADVRAVGTNALRKARNARAFLRRAQAALGHPIEVISGHEEARLIYLGVAHDLADERRAAAGGRHRRRQHGVHRRRAASRRSHIDSLYMGCVTWTLRVLPGGRDPQARRMAKAEIAARLEIEPIERRYRALGWEQARRLLGHASWRSRSCCARTAGRSGGITTKGAGALRKAIVDFALDRPPAPRRPEGRPRAGAARAASRSCSALFDGFGIEKMTVSQGALREGLLYDLLGRIRHEDVREQTIGAMVAALPRRRRVRGQRGAHRARAARPGGADLGPRGRRTPARSSCGPRGCTRSGPRSPTPATTSTAPTCAANTDLPGFSRQDQ